MQQYAVIGRTTRLVPVEREGSYYGECNQICGINHAFMPIKVVAVSKAEFQKWLGDAKKKFAALPPTEQAPGTRRAARRGAAAQPAGN